MMAIRIGRGPEMDPETKNRREAEWLPWNQKQRSLKRSHGAGKGRCKIQLHGSHCSTNHSKSS